MFKNELKYWVCAYGILIDAAEYFVKFDIEIIVYTLYFKTNCQDLKQRCT